jgi:hypothetical protein
MLLIYDSHREFNQQKLTQKNIADAYFIAIKNNTIEETYYIYKNASGKWGISVTKKKLLIYLRKFLEGENNG